VKNMNDLVKATEARPPADLNTLRASLAQVRNALPSSTPSSYLKFDKGAWFFGAESDELKDGTLLAFNPFTIQYGYVCWTNYSDAEKRAGKKNELLGEVLLPMTEPLPALSTLENYGWPWAQQIAMDAAVIDGAHKGAQLIYKTSSFGGRRAISALIDAIFTRLAEDQRFTTPIVKIGCERYKHKNPEFGMIANPVFDIVDWADKDGVRVGSNESVAETSVAAESPRRRRRD